MCAINEGICLVNGEPQCFNKEEYTCHNNEVMFSVAEQECNGQCYDPAVHQCSNGALCPADANGCSPSPDGEGGETGTAVTCQGRRANVADVCSGHGTCVSQDACTYNEGFYGADCIVAAQPDAQCFETPGSDPSVCSGRGACAATDTCTCSTGFSGIECEDVVCPIGKTGAHCECFTCFSVDSDTSACFCKPGFHDKTTSGNTKPCLFAIGQNEFPELQAYTEAFAPAGGSMYSNIFEKGLGPVIENYLAQINENYPGSKALFGLDADTNENAWDQATQDPTYYRKAFCKVANKFRELQANKNRNKT